MLSALYQTVYDVQVEIDNTKNVVRATAMGTTELRAKDITGKRLNSDELKKRVAETVDVGADRVENVADNGYIYSMQVPVVSKKLFGLIKSVRRPTCLIDDEGVIRIQKRNGFIKVCNGDDWKKILGQVIESHTEYNDGGKTLPNSYIVYGKRIIDLSGLLDVEHVLALAEVELQSVVPDDKLIILCSDRTD